MIHWRRSVAYGRAPGSAARCMLVLSLVSSAAHAQRPVATSSGSAVAALNRASVLVANGDTAAAIATLDSALTRDPRDAALWHSVGMLRWGRRRQSVRDVEDAVVLRSRALADSALRLATEIAPDSAQYWLDFARFVRFTDNSARRATLRDALAAPARVAQHAGHASLASSLLDEQGIGAFRNYELTANRNLVSAPNDTRGILLPRSQVVPDSFGQPTSPAGVRKTQETFDQTPRHKWAEWFATNAVAISPPSGAADFEVALRAFRSAVDVDPANHSARDHLYMALAEKRDWPALVAASDHAVLRDSTDTQAWLARGLATHRLERYRDAATSFGKALSYMERAEQLSFTDLSRLLTPKAYANTSRFPDSVAFAAMNPAQRQRWETLFWNLADPRSLTSINEARLEFLARVTFADLRFGYEELSLRGAFSARGMIHIRFGPPDHVYGPGDAIWTYRNGRVFRFRRALAYNNVRLSPAEERVVQDSMLVLEPVGWENTPLARTTRPMRMRVAQFRAGADSMDAVITATVPVRSFLGDAELRGTFAIDVQLDVHDSASRVVGREVRHVSVSADSLPVGINGTWVRRLGRGLNVVRIDAEQADVGRAASATSDAIPEPTQGFGMSDILFGTNATRTGDITPARWRDVSVAPNTGLFLWNQPLGLVWENYELTPHDGNVHYRTTISLHRTFEGTLKGVVARIKANLVNVLEMNSTGTGAMTVSFDQLRPANTVVTDFLAINLTGAAPGPYRLEVEVFDNVSGRASKRTADFVLAPN